MRFPPVPASVFAPQFLLTSSSFKRRIVGVIEQFQSISCYLASWLQRRVVLFSGHGPEHDRSIAVSGERRD